jgi:hypothetical protein
VWGAVVVGGFDSVHAVAASVSDTSKIVNRVIAQLQTRPDNVEPDVQFM